MKAVILVGGEGTRMRPLTTRIPKPLLPVANVAFIVRQIKWLEQFGVTDVVLSLGYLPDAFEEYFTNNPYSGVNISYAVEDEPLGTAGAIKYAAGKFEGNLIVCNGDVFTDQDLSKLLSFHQERNSKATIALTYVEDPSAFGVVPIQPNGEVIAFVEKPPRESAPSHWINAGIYILTPEFMDLIPDGVNVSIERETFPKLLENDKMYALESDSYWLDIGTPPQYLQAHNDYLANIQRFAKDDNLVEVIPNLFSDGEVDIKGSINVQSACLVGAGTTIGDGVTLNAASINHNCIIEDNADIQNSVLFDLVKVDTNSTIDSSIIGQASQIGQDSQICDFTLIGANEKVLPHTKLRGERVGSVV